MSREAPVSYTSSHIQTSKQTSNRASHLATRVAARQAINSLESARHTHLADIPSWVEACRPNYPAGKVGEQHHALPTRTPIPWTSMAINCHPQQRLPAKHRLIQYNFVQFFHKSDVRHSSHLTRSTICINHGLPHRYQHQNYDSLSLSMRANDIHAWFPVSLSLSFFPSSRIFSSTTHS
jgi:hypothetical protein